MEVIYLFWRFIGDGGSWGPAGNGWRAARPRRVIGCCLVRWLVSARNDRQRAGQRDGGHSQVVHSLPLSLQETSLRNPSHWTQCSPFGREPFITLLGRKNTGHYFPSFGNVVLVLYSGIRSAKGSARGISRAPGRRRFAFRKAHALRWSLWNYVREALFPWEKMPIYDLWVTRRQIWGVAGIRLLAVTGQPRSASEVTWLTTQRGWANSGYRALPTETILNKGSAWETPMTVYKAKRDTWVELNNALFTSFSF